MNKRKMMILIILIITLITGCTVNGRKIEIGKPFNIDDFTITVKEVTLLKRNNGESQLKYVYDFTNNSDSLASPDLAIKVSGFQNGQEFSNSNKNTGKYQKLSPGETLFNITDYIDIDNIKIPLSFEIDSRNTTNLSQRHQMNVLMKGL